MINLKKIFSVHKIHLLSFVFSLLFYHSYAGFDFNSNCRQTMQAILDLRLNEARSIIETEKNGNPENGYVIYLQHYAETVELIVTEDVKIYEQLINSYEARMKQMDKLDDGSPDNKWLQAEMLFQTGLAQLKFGTRISGVSKLLGAYRKIKAHREKYPQFWQNQKLTGAFNIILDFIPPFMRWATDMFGVTGNAELGLYQLQHYGEYAGELPGLAEEAIIYNYLGYKLSWKEEAGFAYVGSRYGTMSDITLIKYLYANSASFTYRNDLAIQVLDEINEADLQVQFYSLNYLKGRCKLNHLEEDASIYLEKYLNDFPGSDYNKDVCNRLSFFYLLHGDEQKYREFREKIPSIGSDLRDRDQEALLEYKSGIEPHVGLLKARLLCDGGYFEEAGAVMKSMDPVLLAEKVFQLEYYYRLGRILQLSGHPDEAIPYLNKTFNDGKSVPFTFATRSALYLGKLYEEKKDYRAAYEWYGKCVEIFSDSHTTEGVKDMAVKGQKRVKR
jgi:tetratricopeptide (TPR) repeat protein